MMLSRHARIWWRKGITSDPPVAGWQASFDNGATWVDAITQALVPAWDPDDYGWLIAGPDCTETDATAPGIPVVHLDVDCPIPLLRAIDNPEVVVEHEDGIFLT